VRLSVDDRTVKTAGLPLNVTAVVPVDLSPPMKTFAPTFPKVGRVEPGQLTDASAQVRLPLIIAASAVLLSAARSIGRWLCVVDNMFHGLGLLQRVEKEFQVVIRHVAIPVPWHRSTQNASTDFACA